VNENKKGKQQNMKKIKLDTSTIDYVFSDCIDLFPQYLNKELRDNIIISMIDKLKKQLSQLSIYPTQVEKLKKDVEDKFFQSLVSSGTSVGLLSAQSIGSVSTQMTLNSFHSAGLALQLVVSGVPRLLELLNASKKQKVLTSSFCMKKEFNTNIDYIKKTISHTLKEIKLKELIQKTRITQKRQEIWYDSFFEFFPNKNNALDEATGCISYMLDKNLLYRYNLPLLKIKEMIESRFDGCVVIFSPVHVAQLDIFLFIDITNKKENLSIEDNLKLFYVDTLRKKIETEMTIFGLAGISDYYISKNSDEYIINTYGSNLKDIMQLDYVDKESIKTNNLWEVLEISGIEGARLFLLEEMKRILDNVNDKHIMLLVDTMTHSGVIQSISRYSMKKDRTSVLSRSSFEESLDHFTKASFFGEVEPINSVSSNIILGSFTNIGTGKSKIIPDWKQIM
jgi:DNA-directed RNA polymerase beta' subunit